MTARCSFCYRDHHVCRPPQTPAWIQGGSGGESGGSRIHVCLEHKGSGALHRGWPPPHPLFPARGKWGGKGGGLAAQLIAKTVGSDHVDSCVISVTSNRLSTHDKLPHLSMTLVLPKGPIQPGVNLEISVDKEITYILHQPLGSGSSGNVRLAMFR
jgi:hypothetical protein